MGAGSDAETHGPPGRFPYNFARILERVNYTQTVMGGQIGRPRIPYFSNPRVTYRGLVTGIKGRQDNARVLFERRYDWVL